MFLVHDDEAEILDRREDGRAWTHADARRAVLEPRPLVVALTRAELRVKDRHRVAESTLEARRRLGVSAISGTRTIAERPRSSAAATAFR